MRAKCANITVKAFHFPLHIAEKWFYRRTKILINQATVMATSTRAQAYAVWSREAVKKIGPQVSKMCEENIYRSIVGTYDMRLRTRMIEMSKTNAKIIWMEKAKCLNRKEIIVWHVVCVLSLLVETWLKIDFSVSALFSFSLLRIAFASNGVGVLVGVTWLFWKWISFFTREKKRTTSGFIKCYDPRQWCDKTEKNQQQI